MDFITRLSQYMMENSGELLSLTLEHLLMVAYGMGLALLVGIPLGIIAAKYERIAPIILSATSILQLIPSLAMLAVLMLYFGLGFQTMAIGLFSILLCLLYAIRMWGLRR